LGAAYLLAAVVGSGIMGDRLSGGNRGLALLANSIATGAALTSLILTFGAVSGHFNPVVTLLHASLTRFPRREIFPYILAQIFGAFVGVVLAHGMFGVALFSASSQRRAGVGLLLSEVLATVGLLAVVWATARDVGRSAVAVGAYIAAAYWFTSSTAFANPAVTLARAATETFAGIHWDDAIRFVGAQTVGLVLAVPLLRWLHGDPGARPTA
jgi:glycerol uptake facilitator-like aquaporin